MKTVSARPTDFDRSRRAITWRVRTLTAAMLFVSVAFAIVGAGLAIVYLGSDPEMALVSPGGPSITESADSATAVPTTPGFSRDTAPDVEPRGGEAASSPGPPSTTDAGSEDTGTSSGAGPEERGRWALAQITYPWEDRLPGWTVSFSDGRDGLFGLTLVDDKRIEIYVRDDQPAELLVHIVAHELGHAVDVTLNSGRDRRAWQAARGIEDEPWWPSSAASDFRTGAGDFAESFAYWQAESGNYRSKLGSAPSAAQLELMAELAAG